MEKYFSKVVSLNLPVHTVVNQFHYKQWTDKQKYCYIKEGLYLYNYILYLNNITSKPVSRKCPII